MYASRLGGSALAVSHAYEHSKIRNHAEGSGRLVS